MRDAQNNALDIAQYAINKARALASPISNLQLQKILYYLQGEFSVQCGERLFCDDIEAWRLGPVVPAPYYRYRGYASASLPSQEEPNLHLNEDQIQCLDEVIRKLCQKTAGTLVNQTHLEQPWMDANATDRKIISFEEIKKFFETGKQFTRTI